jgi:hypothetical protein
MRHGKEGRSWGRDRGSETVEIGAKVGERWDHGGGEGGENWVLVWVERSGEEWRGVERMRL